MANRYPQNSCTTALPQFSKASSKAEQNKHQRNVILLQVNQKTKAGGGRREEEERGKRRRRKEGRGGGGGAPGGPTAEVSVDSGHPTRQASEARGACTAC